MALFFKLKAGWGVARRSLLLGALTPFIFACGTAGTSVSAAELPSWVRSPPQDTLQSMYGVGEGPTLHDSTQQALRSIAGRMSTRIKSDAISRSGISGNIATRHYQETVEAYIQDIKLSAYSVRQSELVGSRYFVLVEMSRADFVRDTTLRLNTVDDELRRKLAFTPATSAFDRFLACQTAPATIEQGRLLTLVLSTAEPDFSAAGPLQQYSAYEARCEQVLQGVTLHLQFNPQFAPLAEAIGQQLAVRRVPQGRADARLTVEGKVTEREVFNSKNAMVDLSVALIDGGNAVVARQNYRLNGVSVVSFEAALDDALRKFLATGGADRVLADLHLR
jgi:hypothetical protein